MVDLKEGMCKIYRKWSIKMLNYKIDEIKKKVK